MQYSLPSALLNAEVYERRSSKNPFKDQATKLLFLKHKSIIFANECTCEYCEPNHTLMVQALCKYKLSFFRDRVTKEISAVSKHSKESLYHYLDENLYYSMHCM